MESPVKPTLPYCSAPNRIDPSSNTRTAPFWIRRSRCPDRSWSGTETLAYCHWIGEDRVIHLHKAVNEKLVRDSWNDLLRLAVTIKLKENSAPDIFRRLSSCSRQHALYQTLKAFGQVIKPLFVLRYVDDPDLRQAVERQTGRGGLANRFTRAVAVRNLREFSQAVKEEQEIAEARNRLARNSIICWNCLYPARRLARAPDAEMRKTFPA